LEGILGSNSPEISISYPDNRNPNNRNPDSCDTDNCNSNNRDMDTFSNQSTSSPHDNITITCLADKPLQYKPFINENSEIIISYIKPIINDNNINRNYSQLDSPQQGSKPHTYSGMDFKHNADFYSATTSCNHTSHL
jgi:hypothetical protein